MLANGDASISIIPTSRLVRRPLPRRRFASGAAKSGRAEPLVRCFLVTQYAWRQRDNLAARAILPLPQRLTNAVQIMTIPRGVFASILPNFRNNWVVVHSYNPNSSGEQSVGQAKPWLSTTSTICSLVSALLMCLKFHVSK